MNKYLTTSLCFFVLLGMVPISYAEQSHKAFNSINTINSQAFSPSVFTQLKQKYQGQKWLTLLWSLDCPPCMKELAIVELLQQQKQDLAVVIINVDTFEESEQQRNKIITHFNLTTQTNLYFKEGLEDHSRYSIDPQWFGELPRSYFIDEKGISHGKSGLASEALLTKWLLP